MDVQQKGIMMTDGDDYSIDKKNSEKKEVEILISEASNDSASEEDIEN